jgi:SH3-like domain-containing protein
MDSETAGLMFRSLQRAVRSLAMLGLLALGVPLVLAAPLVIATLGGPGSALAAGESGVSGGSKATTGVGRPGQTGLPLPRFVSLRAAKVNLRTGPGIRYPIDWVYQRRGLPVEVIGEFDTWRRIRDHEGTVGWVHQSMLRGTRTVLLRDRLRVLRQDPEDGAPAVARLEPGVIGELDRCAGAWCQIEVEGLKGWIRRGEIYGLGPEEIQK